MASIHLGNIVITHFADALLMPLVFSGYTYKCVRRLFSLVSFCWALVLFGVMVVSFDFVSFLSRSPLAGALHAVVLARFNY